MNKTDPISPGSVFLLYLEINLPIGNLRLPFVDIDFLYLCDKVAHRTFNTRGVGICNDLAYCSLIYAIGNTCRKEARMDLTTSPVKMIMFQHSPRLDSITALWLAIHTPEGRRKFPGGETAQWKLWGTGTVSPDGLSWQEYQERGVLLIGVGGGPFDEHPSTDFGDRKAEQASATLLMARALGMEKNPLYRGIIKMVTKNDIGLVRSPSELSNTIKLLHRSRGNPFDGVEYAFVAISAMVENQRSFLSACGDFRKNAEVRTFDGSHGPYTIALIHSNNFQMSAAARSIQRNLAVLVQVRNSGHVQILTNQKMGVKMDQVARVIREAELRAESRATEIEQHKAQLGEPGQLPFVPAWCYQMPGQNLLNGSETAPDLQPTRLTPGQICRIIQAHIRFTPAAGRGAVKDTAAAVTA